MTGPVAVAPNWLNRSGGFLALSALRKNSLESKMSLRRNSYAVPCKELVPVFKIYAGNVDRAWSQLDQVKNVAAVKGHVGHLTSAYRLIKPRILRIDQGGAAFDGDDFCGLAQRQL